MELDMAKVYTDFQGLTALRAQAREDQEAALDEVAHQFESLFVQMMLKSMRDAGLGGGLMDSKQSDFYREMYDKQIAMDISQTRGIGLADVIKRQLGEAVDTSYRELSPQDYLGMPILAKPTGRTSDSTTVDGIESHAIEELGFDGSPDVFLTQLWPAAEAAAARLNIAPEALLAQAALETGWGKHVMRHRDGANSHNLFGIKADSRWSGDKVKVNTLEYQDGVAVKTRADFRAYDSYQDSFADYVDFLQSNPRYAQALQRTDDPAAYFSALQEAGYATDPIYADKILRLLDGDAIHQQRQAAMNASAAL